MVLTTITPVTIVCKIREHRLKQKTINNSVELQRILALPSQGSATLDGVNIAQLGQDILKRKISVVDACKKYEKIAELFERRVSERYQEPQGCNDPFVFHHIIKGALSGRIYEEKMKIIHVNGSNKKA